MANLKLHLIREKRVLRFWTTILRGKIKELYFFLLGMVSKLSGETEKIYQFRKKIRRFWKWKQ